MNYRVYYDYTLKKLMFDNGEGGKVMIKEFGDNADKGKWNYIGILIRKIYSNGLMKFQIIGTNTHDDINQFVINHKFDSKFRRLEKKNKKAYKNRHSNQPMDNIERNLVIKKNHKKKHLHKKTKHRKLIISSSVVKEHQ